MQQPSAFSQHAKALLGQHLMSCQSRGEFQAIGKPGSASSCHTAATAQSPACASPPPCVGLRLSPSSAANTDPSRLGSMLSMDSSSSAAAAACGEDLTPLLSQAQSALAVHEALGLTSQCWAGHEALSPCPFGSQAVSCVYHIGLSTSPSSHWGWKPLTPLPPWDSCENHEQHVPACCTDTGYKEDGEGAIQPFHFHINSRAGFWANWMESWCQACCQLMNSTGFILKLCIWQSW